MNTKVLIAFWAVLMYTNSLSASQRIWMNKGEDNGAIHALGNGKMLVYEQGPEIIKAYCSPYTSPPLYQLSLSMKDTVRVFSTRETGTAIWLHKVETGNQATGQFTDFVDSELPVMIRQYELRSPLTFRLQLNPGVMVLQKKDKDSGYKILQLYTNPGAHIYQNYVFPRPVYHEIRIQGKAEIHQDPESNRIYYLTCKAGKGEILFTGGPEYSEMVTNREEIMDNGSAQRLSDTRVFWKKYTERRYDFENRFPARLPLREKLLEVIDEASVMIRVQQSEQGGVMAGYPYPLGYVRDQYGVSRGYLALGYYEEAQKILDFYYETWRKTGELHCAQGIGVDGIFHIHENDEVESPGYLILQAFNLLNTTGNNRYIQKIFPMLEWCWEVQKKHLAGNMLPFNGDETYVAGSILPRSSLNDGSAEASLLFIEGGKQFLRWIEQEKKWDIGKVQEEKEIIQGVEKDFRKNFWKDGQLITNNPDRLNYTEAPRFRHGVCERGGEHCLVYRKEGFGGIDWTERDSNGRYQCVNCLAEGPLPPAEKTIYKLLTVSLTPLYFGSELISNQEITPLLDKIYHSFHKTGVLSSRLENLDPDNNRSVGYDYGFVLFNMIKTSAKGSEEIYRKTLQMADETGAWSEYYLGEKPSGTRCRPWESAINLEALILYGLNQADINPGNIRE